MPKGPRGEKRPDSPVSSIVKAMEVATGIREEEYEDGTKREDGKLHLPPDDSEDDSEDDPEAYEEAALEIPASPKKNKGRNKRRK